MNINAIERTMSDGVNVIEFVDSVDLTGTTFDFPGKYHDFLVQNLGEKALIVTIPPYFRHKVLPGKERRFEKVSLDSVLIRAESGVQGFFLSATRFGPMKYKIEPPSLTDFNYPGMPVTVYEDGNGHYDTDFDVSSKKPAVTSQRHVAMTGLDTNDGLTLATAYRTLNKAVTDATANGAIIYEGIYNRTNAFVNVAVTKTGSFVFQAAPGHNVRIVNCSPQTWVRHGTFTNLFTTAATPITDVYDDKYNDDNGDMLKYKLAANATEANDTPGSYWISGGTLYVHTIDDRVADANIMPMKDQLSAQFKDGTFYFEGISFEGGNTGACGIVKGAAAPKAYFKNCQFKYSINDAGSWGGLTIQGASETICQNCATGRNYNDGFNYHALGGTVPKAIEINCIGRDNGVVSDTDNGSTIHDGGKIFRLNCYYPRNKGSNLGDINDFSQSWNVGALAEDSTAIAEQRYSSNFTAHDGAKVILEGCVSRGGSLNDYTVQDGATMMFRGFKSSNTGRTFEGTGRIKNY